MDTLFIIIDDNRDGKFVLSRALFRQFRMNTIHEHRDFESARPRLAALPEDGGKAFVLLHRTATLEGADLVKSVRAVHPRVPVVALGHPTLAKPAIAAGASQFLDYEAWLRLGTVVKDVQRARAQLAVKPTA